MYLPEFGRLQPGPGNFFVRSSRLRSPGLWLTTLLFLIVAIPGRSQSFAISEFMAANASSVRDEDGDFSDWIEIYNLGSAPSSLLGWYLTDSAQDLTSWQFPAVTVPGNGTIVVFASAKDRRDPLGKLHTNFKLNAAGDYLALVRPDGVTVASEFGPGYPPQPRDVAYGRIMTVTTNQWIPLLAQGSLRVPTNSNLGQSWMLPAFNGSDWTPVTLGVGYYRSNDLEIPPEPGIPLEDTSHPGDLLIPTSANSPGNEGVGNAIDNSSSTKYLNFDKLNTGFTVTLSAGRKVVTGLRLTSANDAPDRDPTSYVLSGSNDGQSWAEIARGPIPNFTARFFTVPVSFTNAVAYDHYKLIFPTVRDAGAAVAMQIAEVEFLGLAADSSTGLADFIQTSVEAALYGHASAYLRIPFTVPDPQQVGPLTLHLRYDDGFVAFLNGTEVARANAPAVPSFDTVAPTNHYRYQAVQEQRFDLSPYVGLIQAGTNVLAIQGFNDRTNSPDFLLQPQLETARVSLGDVAYFQQPTPGSINPAPSLGWVAPVEVSPTRGFVKAPFLVTLYCPSPNSSIYYTTNGTLPSLTNGVRYSGTLHFNGTTTLRATAFAPDWVPSTPVTATYIVLGDVMTQSYSNALDAGFPTTWNGQPADYGLDPRVVGPNGADDYGGKYAASLPSDLQAVPTVSIVMDPEDLFGTQGIYSNPTLSGDAWERPGSLELLAPGNAENFQVNAGLTIQGGAFREFRLTLKKSFRVIFSERFGDSSLKYRLFGPDATGEFDTFTLRAGSNDAWPYDGSGAVYVRDMFAMDSARAMGMTASHGRFFHLYLNGQYWGVYNPVERPDAAFSATYHGGDQGTWDAINQGEVSNGTSAAWNRLFSLLNLDMSNPTNYQRIQGNNPDGTRNPAYENLLNVPSLIDYMILNCYIGNADWPGRNWWVGRDRNDGDGFHFYPWDSETALDVSGVGADVTSASEAVARPYASVRTNAEFRVAFGDRVYRHFFNDGPFYVNPTNSAWNPTHPENNRPAERFAAAAERVSRAIVGESARWGDQLGTGPFTRDEHWQTRRDSILRDYFPVRSANVLAQFRRVGLYPKTDPPVMNQRGGVVTRGFNLTLSASAGTIYYTTNGSDPRTTVTGLPTTAAWRYTGPIAVLDLLALKTRVLNGSEWSAVNEATFIVGVPMLAVSELDYHPADPSAVERAQGFTNADQFEFIELFNAGTGTFDLRGVGFINGIHFAFTNNAVNDLPAGQYVLVVKNRAAFEARYGKANLVAGEYSGQLDNAGERITAVDSKGTILIDFTYGTLPPWPTSTDGNGFSLEVIDPKGNLNMPSNWHPSAFIGGSPGTANPVPRPILQIAGSDPGWLHLRFEGRGGSSYTAYYRDSFSSGGWQVLQRVTKLIDDQPVTVTIPLSNAPPYRFYQIATP
jgi:hypothetical protein